MTQSGRRFWLLRFEGCHVDGEAVFHIGFKQPVVSFVYLLDGMTSTWAVMLCSPQKSSISWVSAMPPMGDPERLRRPKRRLKADTARGFSGAPTRVRVPSRANR